MPDGTLVDGQGNVIGKVDASGRRLACDKDGNIIGYIDETAM